MKCVQKIAAIFYKIRIFFLHNLGDVTKSSPISQKVHTSSCRCKTLFAFSNHFHRRPTDTAAILSTILFLTFAADSQDSVNKIKAKTLSIESIND